MTAYFVSDLHLVDDTDERTLIFVRFLRSLRDRALSTTEEKYNLRLFLVGDIFDLWIADHAYFRETFKTVVAAIKELRQASVQIDYFEGNHDLHLKKFWQDELGVQVHTDMAYFSIGDLVVRVEHGDLINPKDHGYLFLRRFLRSMPLRELSFRLPDQAVTWIGERASRASRTYTSSSKSLPHNEIRLLIRRHAEAAYRQKPYDLLVTGHVHVTDDFVLGTNHGRAIRSINLGAWFEECKAFVLEPTGGRFTVLK